MPCGSHQELWQKLSRSVAEICEGRDASHGHEHMQKVAVNSVRILKGEITEMEEAAEEVGRLVVIVAWLHDVADHKYDTDGTLQMRLERVLSEVCRSAEEAALVCNIIDRISFSKEQKVRAQSPDGCVDWLALLGTPVAVSVRHIVSDADKMEAIGEEGVTRCLEYSQHDYSRRNGGAEIPSALAMQHVLEHADEKLLRLKDEFMYTQTGKALAQPLHDQMVGALAKLEQQLEQQQQQ